MLLKKKKSYSTFNPCAMNSRSTWQSSFNQRLHYRVREGGREGGGRAGELCPSSSDFPSFCFFTPPSFLVFALAENSEFQTAAPQMMANSHRPSPFTTKEEHIQSFSFKVSTDSFMVMNCSKVVRSIARF